MGVESLMIAGMVAGGMGQVVSGIGGLQAAKAEQKQIKMQRAAEGATQAQNELDRTREMRALLAEQRVTFAASGVDPNAGTPADIAAVSKDRFDESLTLDRALAAARDKSLKLKSKAAGRRGGMSLIGGMLGAAQVGVGGYAKIKSIRAGLDD